MSDPKYHINQMLKIKHSWAKDIPPRPVDSIVWDPAWNCYTCQ